MRTVTAIDLFCGAGGLSYGLKSAGVCVVAGIDLDPACAYPFESNVDASFFERDVRDLTGDDLFALWGDAELRALVGCAPCRPSPPIGGAPTPPTRWTGISFRSSVV